MSLPRCQLRIIGVLVALAPVAPAAAANTLPETLVRVADDAAQAGVRKTLGPSWRKAETDHFRVYSDASLRYHRLIAGLLEQFHQEVHPRFFTRPLPKVDVYLVEGGKDYERFLEARGLGEHATGYGVYDDSKRTLYARRRFPDGRLSGVGTLFHEAVHALVHAEVGDRPVPVWFNEGFASLFEQGRIVEGKWVYGNPNPWREKLFRPEFEAGRVPSLAQYLALSPEQYHAEDRERTNYNTGRSLCLYLLRRHGEPAVQKYVRAVLGGSAGKQALEQATGKPLAEIEKEWRENIRRMNFGGDYLERASGKDALRILEEGAKLFPDYGMLRLALAEEYADAKRYKAATEHAQAALADPRLIEPHRAYRVLALTYWDAKPKQAAAALDRIVALQPWVEGIDETSFKDLAALRKHLKDARGAAQVLKQLAELKRDDD